MGLEALSAHVSHCTTQPSTIQRYSYLNDGRRASKVRMAGVDIAQLHVRRQTALQT
jgi:hypothetical protein